MNDIAGNFPKQRPKGLKSFEKSRTVANKRIFRNLAQMAAATSKKRVHVSRREKKWVAHIEGLKNPIITANIESFKAELTKNLEKGRKIFFHKPMGQVDFVADSKLEIEEYFNEINWLELLG